MGMAWNIDWMFLMPTHTRLIFSSSSTTLYFHARALHSQDFPKWYQMVLTRLVSQHWTGIHKHHHFGHYALSLNRFSKLAMVRIFTVDYYPSFWRKWRWGPLGDKLSFFKTLCFSKHIQTRFSVLPKVYTSHGLIFALALRDGEDHLYLQWPENMKQKTSSFSYIIFKIRTHCLTFNGHIGLFSFLLYIFPHFSSAEPLQDFIVSQLTNQSSHLLLSLYCIMCMLPHHKCGWALEPGMLVVF